MLNTVKIGMTYLVISIFFRIFALLEKTTVMKKYLLIIALFITTVVCAQTKGEVITVNGKDYKIESVEKSTKISNGMSLVHYNILSVNSHKCYRISYDTTKGGKVVGKVAVKLDEKLNEVGGLSIESYDKNVVNKMDSIAKKMYGDMWLDTDKVVGKH